MWKSQDLGVSRAPFREACCSAFELAVKWWFPVLHPSWQRQAVSEQASAKEGGGSLLLLTPDGVCFAHSGGMLRVTKALGAMSGFAEERVWACCAAEGT